MVDQQEPQPRRELRSRVKRYALVAALVATALAVWGIGSRIAAREQLRRTTAAEAVLTVATAKPVLSNAGNELVLPGIVQAYTESPIYARTNGYLKVWYTDIGARVHKGQLLAQIETPEVDRELAQARADLDTAEANFALSKITNERWQGLLKKQAVSKQDADNRAGDAAAKAAMVESALQNVKRLSDLESFKRVIAPFDGVVTARNTDVGYLINAGQAPGTELFRLADIHKLRIYAQVPEAYAAAAQTGVKAELHFAERPGKTYEAEAVRTSNALDPSARTLQVELQLDNREARLFPGSYTEVHFKLPSSTETLRLPANTILFRAQGLQVAVVENRDTIEIKNVDQGRDFGKTVEILNGLSPNDMVVINPPDSIETGTRVHIAPAPQSSADQSGGAHAAP
ncbi:MAG TPA: efflux RND transporter periplasmic adaptor subunit [Steroidobacteraceae bacterium]|nr:efflux RND transporter periplasmic adaptor subunit [Steroidobacteraceae bacterium]